MRRAIGFQSYRARIEQEFSSRSGRMLSDYLDDDTLYSFYRQDEPTSFVLASLGGEDSEED